MLLGCATTSYAFCPGLDGEAVRAAVDWAGGGRQAVSCGFQGTDGVTYDLGVDLGTTFVAAAIARPNQAEMFTLGDRSVVAPSVIYRADDGQLISGDAANRRAVSNPERVVREFKRRLGDPTPVMLAGTEYTVSELIGAVLGDVLRKVTETEGEPPGRVVLTHPANW